MAVLGVTVAGPEGHSIGRLVDVLVDSAGVPQAAVIDFGGFMGVGARKIAVHWIALHFAPTDPKRPVTLNMTADQIKAAPEYKEPGLAVPVVIPLPPGRNSSTSPAARVTAPAPPTAATAPPVAPSTAPNQQTTQPAATPAAKSSATDEPAATTGSTAPTVQDAGQKPASPPAAEATAASPTASNPSTGGH